MVNSTFAELLRRAIKMKEDAPLEERAPQRTEHTETQRTSAPNMDPKKKAPMPLEQPEREAEEETFNWPFT